MPSGTARAVAMAVITSVPYIAGPIPPWPAGEVAGGIGAVRNCQLMIEAALATTVMRTNTSGTMANTNAMTISVVMMMFLVRRQDGGSRRLTFCGPAVTAIRHPVRVGRNVPRLRGR